jgi:hypothetical protein
MTNETNKQTKQTNTKPTYKLSPSYPLTHGETLKTGMNGTNGSMLAALT